MTARVMRAMAAGRATSNHTQRRSTYSNPLQPHVPTRGRGAVLATGRSGVETFAQILAGLEEGHEFFGHRYGGAGARIATLPRCPMLDRERTKTPELDPVTARQGLDDLVEDDVNDALDVAMVEMVIGRRNFLNELGLDHGSASPPLVESHCNSLSFGSLPNGDESVKAQSAKRSLLAHQIPKAFRVARTSQLAQRHRRQGT